MAYSGTDLEKADPTSAIVQRQNCHNTQQTCLTVLTTMTATLAATPAAAEEVATASISKAMK